MDDHFSVTVNDLEKTCRKVMTIHFESEIPTGLDSLVEPKSDGHFMFSQKRPIIFISMTAQFSLWAYFTAQDFEQFPSIRPILKHFSSQSKNIFLFSRSETFSKMEPNNGYSRLINFGNHEYWINLSIGWNINALIIHTYIYVFKRGVITGTAYEIKFK